MNRNRSKFSSVVVMLAMILAPSVARADGGVVRARAAQGPFVITLFTPAEISATMPTEMTVLVQKRETEEVVLDAVVELSLVPPIGVSLSPNDPLCGPADLRSMPGQPAGTTRSSVPLQGDKVDDRVSAGAFGRPAAIRTTRGSAANRLFYSATVVLRVAGDWQLNASVRQAGNMEEVVCPLPVGRPERRLAALWPYLTLPPISIVLFGLNQWLRRKPAK